MRKKNGFSLIEVLVSAVVFSLVMLGMVSVFISAKRFMSHARERMVSAEIGKFFIDPLQMDVKFENWGQAGNILTSGGSGVPQRINGVDFSGTHAVTAVPDATPLDPYDNLRRVITTISWTELGA
ncbi:MAG: prepilin-type N-terminal cleavage/methylation domain-containing protein [Candidatus Omnitrophota bacterium]